MVEESKNAVNKWSIVSKGVVEKNHHPTISRKFSCLGDKMLDTVDCVCIRTFFFVLQKLGFTAHLGIFSLGLRDVVVGRLQIA
jgi:hypothetical protein